MNLRLFIQVLIFVWACRPGIVLRADPIVVDPVEDFIGKLFGIEGGSQAEDQLEKKLQDWDPKLSRSSSEKEINRSYKVLSLKNHPDKNDPDKRKEFDEKFKELNNAFEPFRNKDRYNEILRVARCVKFYGICVKGAAAATVIYGLLLACTLGKSFVSTTPHMILSSLYSFSHGSIDTLLSCSFDRYKQDVKAFLMDGNINVLPLLEKLPEGLSENLMNSIAIVDQRVSEAYEKIAWHYYDCTSRADVSAKDPQMVQDITAAIHDLDDVIDACKQELSPSKSTIPWKAILGSLACVGGVLTLGAAYMYYDLSHKPAMLL